MIVITNNDRMGKNILTLRQKYQLSQQDFARWVGMDINHLHAIEQGIQTEIDARIITEICMQFQITAYSLMEDCL